MKETYTLEELTQKFGTDKQKEALVKNNGNLKANPFNALIKTVEQHYESVTVEGRGKKRIIICEGKREEIALRQDARENNGGGQVPMKYEQAFPIMVLQSLLEMRDAGVNETVLEKKVLTVAGWLQKMKFITPEMFEARKCRYNDAVLERVTEGLSKRDVVGFDDDFLVKEYFDKEIDRLSKYFMSTVQKLHKAKLVEHVPYKMGRCQVPEISEHIECGELTQDIQHTEKFIILTPFVADAVANIHTQLQSLPQFSYLTLQEINQLKNKKEVKEYWTEYNIRLNNIKNEQGERLYLTLTYTAHGLFVKSGQNQMIKWLEKNNKEAIKDFQSDETQYFINNRKEFHETLNQYVVDLAEKRQEKFINQLESNSLGKVNESQFEESKFKRVKDLMLKKRYVDAYQKLQDYFGYEFSVNGKNK
ncbi:TPA: hypothetical protein ROX79_005071 [Bacillus thuringiensis]|nr:hypothetical protein [Bacillus thuringiensis]